MYSVYVLHVSDDNYCQLVQSFYTEEAAQAQLEIMNLVLTSGGQKSSYLYPCITKNIYSEDEFLIMRKRELIEVMK